VKWIWISVLFFIAGTAIAIWPDKRAALRAEERQGDAAPRRENKNTETKVAREKVLEKV
jgi:hypothetical protein